MAALREPTDSGPFDTTEVRWFAAGELPALFIAGFSAMPGAVHREARTDTYLRDGSIDVGIKRRGSGPVEIKSLLPFSGVVDIGAAVPGRVEEWRKTRGAAGRSDGGLWVDVEKDILKRFHERSAAGSGCQTELTSLLVAGVAAWTFAFEAWGPTEVRRSLLSRIVDEFRSESRLGQEFAASLQQSMGYPEWLTTVAGNANR